MIASLDARWRDNSIGIKMSKCPKIAFTTVVSVTDDIISCRYREETVVRSGDATDRDIQSTWLVCIDRLRWSSAGYDVTLFTRQQLQPAERERCSCPDTDRHGRQIQSLSRVLSEPKVKPSFHLQCLDCLPPLLMLQTVAAQLLQLLLAKSSRVFCCFS